MIKYIAFDPGGTTGVAEFDDSGSFTRRFKLSEGLFLRTYLETLSTLPEPRPKIIIENFKFYPWMTERLRWDGLHVCRTIGEIQYAAWIAHCETFLQEPHQKDMTAKHLGFNYKSHLPDDKSAHAHGVKWLTDNKIITLKKAIEDNDAYQQRN